MKVLVIQPGNTSSSKLKRALKDERNSLIPRWSVFDAAFETHARDFSWLRSAPRYRRRLYKTMPPYIALACEAFCRRKEYDAVISWTERLSVPFALLQSMTFHRTPHIALLYWMSKPNVRFPLSLAHRAVTRIITWSSVQRNFAIQNLRIPEHKIALVKHFVDPDFWTPFDARANQNDPFICSAGAEMRDYQTLIEAMEVLPIQCHIAAQEIRVLRGLRATRVDPKSMTKRLPENITVQPQTPLGLRGMYRKSRFVVVPLLPSDTDNGVTVILEAMACGKAVICTRTRGQVDVIEDGVTGIFVDGDSPGALRSAILDLWDNPAKAEQLGRNARSYIENSRHPIGRFVRDAKQAVLEAIVSKPHHIELKSRSHHP